jgi:hypothetical protein
MEGGGEEIGERRQEGRGGGVKREKYCSAEYSLRATRQVVFGTDPDPRIRTSD